LFQSFKWTRQEQGTILSAFLWGYAVTQVPAGYLTSNFGAKRLMGVSLAGSSLLLVAIPFVASEFGWIGVTVLRVLTGAIQVRDATVPRYLYMYLLSYPDTFVTEHLVCYYQISFAN